MISRANSHHFLGRKWRVPNHIISPSFPVSFLSFVCATTSDWVTFGISISRSRNLIQIEQFSHQEAQWNQRRALFSDGNHCFHQTALVMVVPLQSRKLGSASGYYTTWSLLEHCVQNPEIQSQVPSFRFLLVVRALSNQDQVFTVRVILSELHTLSYLSERRDTEWNEETITPISNSNRKPASNATERCCFLAVFFCLSFIVSLLLPPPPPIHAEQLFINPLVSRYL